jgi:hypothetical protein
MAIDFDQANLFKEPKPKTSQRRAPRADVTRSASDNVIANIQIANSNDRQHESQVRTASNLNPLITSKLQDIQQPLLLVDRQYTTSRRTP